MSPRMVMSLKVNIDGHPVGWLARAEPARPRVARSCHLVGEPARFASCWRARLRGIIVPMLLCGLVAGCGGGNPFPMVRTGGTIRYHDGTVIPAESLRLVFASQAPSIGGGAVPPSGDDIRQCCRRLLWPAHDLRAWRWVGSRKASSGGRCNAPIRTSSCRFPSNTLARRPPR